MSLPEDLADRSGIDCLAGEFVIGPENRLPGLIIRSFFEDRPDREHPLSKFGPIVVYGPSGSGKTHLVRGLATWWSQRHPGARVIVLSAADFARGHAEALEHQELDAWRASLRGADLFVLEDLGQLAGKSPAQVELVHALDELAGRESLVVVTARSLPRSMTTQLPGLRSRLSAGLSIPLALPGPSARRAILEQLAKARGLTLPKGMLQSLSGGPSVPVPALFGAIRQLELAARTDSGDAARLEQMTAEQIQQVRPTLREIATAASRHFGFKLADLKSASRRQAVVVARGVAFYLARQLTDHSLQEIGKYFGGRDHTTVLHGQRRTEKMLKRDPATRHAISELRKSLAA